MAYLEPLAQKLSSSKDWTGFTLGDLRSALLSALATTYPEAKPGMNLSRYQSVVNACTPYVDYFLYLYCDPFGTCPEHISIEECVRSHCDDDLDKDSRGILINRYMNAYFYKFITATELPLLRSITEANPELSLSEAIDYYITRLLYPEVVEANPGKFFTYENIEGVSESRRQGLNSMSQTLAKALNQGDQQGAYKTMYLLMTYYVGSEYRRVHAAVSAVFDIEMSDMREYFTGNIAQIIAKRGSMI